MLYPALVLASLASLPVAKVGSTTLTELCDQATTIVIGSVKRIDYVATPTSPGSKSQELAELGLTVPIAELTVERTILGDAGIGRVRFLATGTWMCDVSSAAVGEKLLLFLAPWDRYDEAIKVKEYAATQSASEPIRQICWSGRGRMSFVLQEDGSEQLEVSSDVILPKGLRLSDGRTKRFELLEYVSNAARFVPSKLALRVGGWRGTRTEAKPKDESFDFRVLRDGSYRLALGDQEEERVEAGSLDVTSLVTLASSLRDVDTYAGAEKLDGFRGWPRGRWLYVDLPAAKFEDQLFLGTERVERARARGFMAHWTIVRSLVPNPACMGSADP